MKVKSIVVFFGKDEKDLTIGTSRDLHAAMVEKFKAVEILTTHSFMVDLGAEYEVTEMKGEAHDEQTVFETDVVSVIRDAVPTTTRVWIISEAQYSQYGCCISKTLATV